MSSLVEEIFNERSESPIVGQFMSENDTLGPVASLLRLITLASAGTTALFVAL